MTKTQPRSVRPGRLSAGDTIGIVAPASPFDKASFQNGIDAIHSMGFATKIDPRAYHGVGYLAGEDAQRADQVNAMFGDDDVQAVMCARGGYGSLRILERLDYKLMAVHPKPLIGFSDITALHQAAYQKCRLATFHGPTVTTLGKSDEATRRSWLDALTQKNTATVAIAQESFLKTGTAQGILVGGNLTVLSHLIGTPYWISLKDKLLVIEDVGEAAYRIDRMLFQMKMAGLLDGLAGLVMGNFERCGDPASIQHVAKALLQGMDIPIAVGLPVGHGDTNLTLILGAPARLDSDAGELAFLKE